MMRRKKHAIDVRRTLIIAGLSVLLLWLLFLLYSIWKKEEIARHAADDARRELAALEEREETLAGNLEDLRTERGREGSLRETYGVARPGEEVIIVVPPGDGETLEELSWWRKFLGFFGL